MKTQIKLMTLIAVLGWLAIPAYADEMAAGMPGKTLSDFQKEYSGTKPIVAWNKYQEYLQLQKTPRPTLEPSRARMEANLPADSSSGTKAVVAFTKSANADSEGLAKDVKQSGNYMPERTSGTKSIVAFTK